MASGAGVSCVGTLAGANSTRAAPARPCNRERMLQLSAHATVPMPAMEAAHGVRERWTFLPWASGRRVRLPGVGQFLSGKWLTFWAAYAVMSRLLESPGFFRRPNRVP